MKQIIPFKKELLFKTKVSEITSISLEHTLTLKNDDLISGEFYISGDYKMTEGSINREKFEFKLPFDIALDSRYNIASIIIDIDNFYYEIINSESLQINIDVYVEGEKIEETSLKEDLDIIDESTSNIETKEEAFFEPIIEQPFIEESENRHIETPIIIENDLDNKEEIFEKSINPAPMPKATLTEEVISNNFNIFDNMDNSDTYMTYYVYIVKEDDNIDKILNKYNVTKEELSLYNNIEDIKKGTKLIIPSSNNNE